MGQVTVSAVQEGKELRQYSRTLLDDLRALERMCADGRIEAGTRHIGAEQEMFLVDRGWRPAPWALDVLEELKDPAFTTEIGLFNLEYNATPRLFAGNCLSALATELETALARVREVVRRRGGDVQLTGILPTLDRAHLGLDSLTPLPRYFEMNRVMTEMAGGAFRTHIRGTDNLDITHDNIMLEACNSSFQLHYQVAPAEFARLYNLSQAAAAPVLAAAVNSPLLLGCRLWHETRIALFEQSVDERSEHLKARGSRARVTFGDAWVRESVIEIFQEHISRYRVLVSSDLGESSLALLERGETPPLRALCLHNGTVYRWNRPCYGVANGVPHLRIETRAIPAGPTIVDQVANAAFYFGLLAGLSRTVENIAESMLFDHAKDNFFAAARYGLNARVRWLDGRSLPARDLILDTLLPIAAEGLATGGVDQEDVDRYLQILEQRVATGRTGAQWMLDSLDGMSGIRNKSARFRVLTAAATARERTGQPVHTWALAVEEDWADWREGYRTVGQLMTTDLFTVHPDDAAEFVAFLMYWNHIRHIPVEDHEGRLVGLISHRALLRLQAAGLSSGQEPVAAEEIMVRDPVTVTPETPCLDAVDVMRTHQVSCLPVLRAGKLVGIITARDFMTIAQRLFETQLREGLGGEAAPPA